MSIEKSSGFLYKTIPGRAVTKIAVQPWISKTAGAFLDSKLSAGYINKFIKDNNIDMSQYEKTKYKSFNDFFTRKIKYSARPINYCPTNLISPCDARLTVSNIKKDSHFNIKGIDYTVGELLRNSALADRYNNGYCMVFRLSPDDYHRYCYIDNGVKSRNVTINGVFNTVQPVATERLGVYKENTREYTVLRTDNFGDVIHMEVGALLVGKINNFHGKSKIVRGHEKGMFEFGGSTIILIIKQGMVEINSDIIENSSNDIETRVLYGQVIGRRME